MAVAVEAVVVAAAAGVAVVVAVEAVAVVAVAAAGVAVVARAEAAEVVVVADRAGVARAVARAALSDRSSPIAERLRARSSKPRQELDCFLSGLLNLLLHGFRPR